MRKQYLKKAHKQKLEVDSPGYEDFRRKTYKQKVGVDDI